MAQAKVMRWSPLDDTKLSRPITPSVVEAYPTRPPVLDRRHGGSVVATCDDTRNATFNGRAPNARVSPSHISDAPYDWAFSQASGANKRDSVTEVIEITRLAATTCEIINEARRWQ